MPHRSREPETVAGIVVGPAPLRPQVVTVRGEERSEEAIPRSAGPRRRRKGGVGVIVKPGTCVLRKELKSTIGGLFRVQLTTFPREEADDSI